ncbi:glycosyltransferase [Terrabacter sp. Soil811]|uniref:glycosyltransferase n=1 Tax=Terrabacter sp. Soil811 TaxID=1736419 RepID=UPI0009EC7E69|nr:glycosyltransferase [Terrabacter sp. Soil811]
MIMSREASPLSSGRVERRLLRDAGHSVYDFDDALFHDLSAVRRYLGQHGKCQSLVSAADVVIAGNDYLAEWASAFSSNVTMVPSCVEPDDYLQKSSWETAERPVIVWLGSPSTEQFVADIAGPLRTVHEMTGARLRLVSGASDNPALGSINHMIDRIPWSPTSFAPALASSDIAIGPLTDTPFARGKCAYKLLQYAAAALPMVAAPVGANALALQRFDGLSASTPSDWTEALTELLSEPSSGRKRRGDAARDAVERYYAFSAWSREWASALGLRL